MIYDTSLIYEKDRLYIRHIFKYSRKFHNSFSLENESSYQKLSFRAFLLLHEESFIFFFFLTTIFETPDITRKRKRGHVDVACLGYHLKRDHCRVNQASPGIRWNSRRVKVYRVDKNLREEDQRKRCAPLYFVPPPPPSPSSLTSNLCPVRPEFQPSHSCRHRRHACPAFIYRKGLPDETPAHCRPMKINLVEHQINDSPSCIYN